MRERGGRTVVDVAGTSVKPDRPEYPGSTRDLLGGADVRARVGRIVKCR